MEEYHPCAKRPTHVLESFVEMPSATWLVEELFAYVMIEEDLLIAVMLVVLDVMT